MERSNFESKQLPLKPKILFPTLRRWWTYDDHALCIAWSILGDSHQDGIQGEYIRKLLTNCWPAEDRNDLWRCSGTFDRIWWLVTLFTGISLNISGWLWSTSVGSSAMNNPDIFQISHGEHKIKSRVPRFFNSLWISSVPLSVPSGGVENIDDTADPEELLCISVCAFACGFVVESWALWRACRKHWSSVR